MPSRPVPTTRAAWVEEVLAALVLDPRPEPGPAAVAAWSVGRLAEVWDEPVEIPGEVAWTAQYLAGQVHLGHLSGPVRLRWFSVLVFGYWRGLGVFGVFVSRRRAGGVQSFNIVDKGDIGCNSAASGVDITLFGGEQGVEALL